MGSVRSTAKILDRKRGVCVICGYFIYGRKAGAKMDKECAVAKNVIYHVYASGIFRLKRDMREKRKLEGAKKPTGGKK